jgi:hypothetical protein
LVRAADTAKKLYPDSSRYETLKSCQAATLIKRSVPNGLAAFYCFYNSSWPSRSGRPSAGACCSSHRHQEDFGCTLAPAFEVFNRAYAGRTRLGDFEQISVPWQCLLCCLRSRYRNLSLPRRVKDSALHLDPFGSEALEERTLQEGPPGYVGDVEADRLLEGVASLGAGERGAFRLFIAQGADAVVSDDRVSCVF